MYGANSTGQVYCFAAAVARRGTQNGRSGRDDIDWYRGAVGVQDGIEDGFLRHFEVRGGCRNGRVGVVVDDGRAHCEVFLK